MKRSELEKLGKTQLYTLRERGCPEQIIEMLKEKLPAAIDKALTMVIPDNHLAILPIIKPAYLGYYGLMAMVRNGGKAGYAYLNPTQISDVVDAPQEPYYIYDVEDGSSTRGKSPENAEKIFKKQSRSPLTAAEVVNLCILTDVLSKHYVWATGSRYGSAGGVPDVYLVGGDRPGLGWDYVGSSDGRWRSASCGSR